MDSDNGNVLLIFNTRYSYLRTGKALRKEETHERRAIRRQEAFFYYLEISFSSVKIHHSKERVGLVKGGSIAGSQG